MKNKFTCGRDKSIFYANPDEFTIYVNGGKFPLSQENLNRLLCLFDNVLVKICNFFDISVDNSEGIKEIFGKVRQSQYAISDFKQQFSGYIKILLQGGPTAEKIIAELLISTGMISEDCSPVLNFSCFDQRNLEKGSINVKLLNEVEEQINQKVPTYHTEDGSELFDFLVDKFVIDEINKPIII